MKYGFVNFMMITNNYVLACSSLQLSVTNPAHCIFCLVSTLVLITVFLQYWSLTTACLLHCSNSVNNQLVLSTTRMQLACQLTTELHMPTVTRLYMGPALQGTVKNGPDLFIPFKNTCIEIAGNILCNSKMHAQPGWHNQPPSFHG
jgi:hypothetical protein